MMQRMWQKKLKLNYSKNVIDIVQFGSSVFEEKEARDFDIAVVFNNAPIKQQLEEAQQIKKQIEISSEKEIHISTFDLSTFFDNSNFSREGIIFYGKSLISATDFCRRFGLNPVLQISYSLKKLKKKDKVRFHYMLQGRAGKYGLLRKYGGQLINSGLIEFPPEYEEIFVKAIKEIISDFSLRRVLIVK